MRHRGRITVRTCIRSPGAAVPAIRQQPPRQSSLIRTAYPYPRARRSCATDDLDEGSGLASAITDFPFGGGPGCILIEAIGEGLRTKPRSSARGFAVSHVRAFPKAAHCFFERRIRNSGPRRAEDDSSVACISRWPSAVPAARRAGMTRAPWRSRVMSSPGGWSGEDRHRAPDFANMDEGVAGPTEPASDGKLVRGGVEVRASRRRQWRPQMPNPFVTAYQPRPRKPRRMRDNPHLDDSNAGARRFGHHSCNRPSGVSLMTPGSIGGRRAPASSR